MSNEAKKLANILESIYLKNSKEENGRLEKTLYYKSEKESTYNNLHEETIEFISI